VRTPEHCSLTVTCQRVDFRYKQCYFLTFKQHFEFDILNIDASILVYNIEEISAPLSPSSYNMRGVRAHIYYAYTVALNRIYSFPG